MHALPHTHTLHTHYTHTLHTHYTHTTHTLHTVHTCGPEAALLSKHSFSVCPGVPYHCLLLMYALPHTLHTHTTHTLHTHYTHYTHYIPVALRQLFLVNTALVSAQVCPITACFSCTHYHTHTHYTHTTHTHYTHTLHTHTTHSTYL